MKELGRLLNRKTILLILAAACICVVVVFAKDFSECGIDNYKIKVREYNWLINGHTDEQIQQHADELAQDDRRIFKRLAKEYKEKCQSSYYKCLEYEKIQCVRYIRINSQYQ